MQEVVRRSKDHEPVGTIMFPQLFVFTNRIPTDPYPYRWLILSSPELQKKSMTSTKKLQPKLYIVPSDYFTSETWASDTEMRNYLSNEFIEIDHFGGYLLLEAQGKSRHKK